MQQLGVGRQADVLGLHRGMHRNPRQVLGPQAYAFCHMPETGFNTLDSSSPGSRSGAYSQEGCLSEFEFYF
jgi:hypothetical protein